MVLGNGVLLKLGPEKSPEVGQTKENEKAFRSRKVQRHQPGGWRGQPLRVTESRVCGKGQGTGEAKR